MLSGIQHFAFCRRQWALIHLEQLWEQNALTAEGDLLHRRAHDEELRERRGDTLIVRGLAVRSYRVGLSGICDIVEFHTDRKGHPLAGEDGLWRALPVEYKRGRSKVNDADRLQLCAQAMALEEMLGCDVGKGCLYYGETHSREHVDLGQPLRNTLIKMSEEMHRLYHRHHTPKVKPFAACRSCSLVDICLSRVVSHASVNSYIRSHVSEGR